MNRFSPALIAVCLLPSIGIVYNKAADAAVPAYRVITLGTFPEEGAFPGGTARAVSDGRLPVGELNAYFEGQWLGSRAARWSDLDAPLNQGDLLSSTDSFSNSIARDVNESGVSVGSSFGRLPGISGSPAEAVWWGADDTLPNRLPRAESGPAVSRSLAYAVNESGVVVGETRYILDGSWDALVWPSVTSEPLSLPDFTFGDTDVLSRIALDVNDNGLVVGFGERSPLDFSSPRNLPVVWDANNNFAPTVPSFDPRIPEDRAGGRIDAVNASGQIAGAATVWDESLGRAISSPVRWNSVDEPPEPLEQARQLGGSSPFSIVQDINDSGVVVGFTRSNGDPDRAVVWDENADFNYLDDLLLGAPDVNVLRAFGINNDGWIVGIADTANGARAVLLAPIPEPSSAMVLLMMIACAATRRTIQR